jgi:hypothetical protein
MKKVFASATIALLLLIVITRISLATLSSREENERFITTSTTIHSVMEDKFNEVIDLSSTVTYTGALEGISTLNGTLIVRRDGSANFQGTETFTGFVNGVPGTLTFKVVGSSDLYQTIKLTNLITSGTGELAGLHGVISKAGIIKDNGPVGTYIWQVDQG